MISCVIIDDEPLAREGLANYVREVDFLQLAGTCENPLELLPVMDKQAVDLIFLDIQMPKMNGIDFLKILQNPPMAIIVSAYPSYALEGFQLNVMDYLLKPVTFERFFKAASKARDYQRLLEKALPGSAPPIDSSNDYFFIKCGNKFEKIPFGEILFIEAKQNYVTIHTLAAKYMTILSMKHLEENLDPDAFIRVHKSFIAAIGRIDSIEGNEICIKTNRIPISRNYREQVIAQVVTKNLWGRK